MLSTRIIAAPSASPAARIADAAPLDVEHAGDDREIVLHAMLELAEHQVAVGDLAVALGGGAMHRAAEGLGQR